MVGSRVQATAGRPTAHVHNRYVVTFQGNQLLGGSMEANAYLFSAYQMDQIAGNFFKLLRNILTNLCEWLDSVEEALVKHLETQSSIWKPMVRCPLIPLGLGFPTSGVTYHPLYFPVPLCEGADPLPWTIDSGI